MKVKELHDWEQEVYQKYQDGIINEVSYLGKVYLRSKFLLEQIEEDTTIANLNEVRSYLKD
jgi:hypothetical protein